MRAFFFRVCNSVLYVSHVMWYVRVSVWVVLGGGWVNGELWLFSLCCATHAPNTIQLVFTVDLWKLALLHLLFVCLFILCYGITIDKSIYLFLVFAVYWNPLRLSGSPFLYDVWLFVSVCVCMYFNLACFQCAWLMLVNHLRSANIHFILLKYS